MILTFIKKTSLYTFLAYDANNNVRKRKKKVSVLISLISGTLGIARLIY